MLDLNRVQDVLFEVQELPVEDRRAYLEKIGMDEPDIRDEVEWMLSANDDGPLFPDIPLPAQTEVQMVGRQIGPYRLVKELGRGGMGAVYLGVRADHEIEMSVSIKLIKDKLHSRNMISRFRQERQLLADLRHPNIAMLLDAGTSDEGLPYFIMEYIEGCTVDAWSTANQPSPADLIQMFRKTVSAVGFAHACGVIHSDIKPGNVMVNPEGEPKLLDFGIARLIRPDGDEGNEFTHGMTPEYAAPELLRGQPPTQAGDIYALGLVLLQLLTGKAPSKLKKRPLDAVEELSSTAMISTITQGEEKLQDNIGSGRSERDPPPLEAAPDAIAHVLRNALMEDPAYRYKTVDMLLADLDRVTARLPQPKPVARDQPFDVLIWFHPDDAAQVAILAAHLERMGVRVWNALREDAGERHLAGAMISALQECKTCLVCLGSDFHKPWLDDAAFRDSLSFMAGAIRILPLLLPDAAFPEMQSNLPLILRDRTWITLPEGLTAVALDRLVGVFKASDAEGESTHLGVCPFRGLEVFREADRQFFFGREALVQRVTAHLSGHAFMAVLGLSGSGKSSTVQAGVIPRRRAAGDAIALCTPTTQPLKELGRVLDQIAQTGMVRLNGSAQALLADNIDGLHEIGRAFVAAGVCDRLLVVIDQFEEIFTLGKDDPFAGRFVENLCRAVDRRYSVVSVLITMRSDFFGKCAIYPQLNTLLTEHCLQVPPMSRDDVARVVDTPARLAGLQFEAGLLARIVDDTEAAGGELPLLEHALLELYQRREGDLLTLAAYSQIGGIEGALARRAESEFAALETEEQDLLRRMFTLCLIHPGEGAEDSRRRSTREELLTVGDSSATVHRLLDHLIKARLLTGADGVDREHQKIEVAHEALIRKWSRIGEWMAEDREKARLLSRFRQYARAWRESGNHTDHLLRGATLLQMVELKGRCRLGEHEQALLDASTQARERETRVRHRIRNLVLALGIGGVLLALASFGLFLRADRAQQEARRSERKAGLEKRRAEQKTKEANFHLAGAYNYQAGAALDAGRADWAWLYSLAAQGRAVPADRDLPEPRGRFLDPRMSHAERLLWASPFTPLVGDVALTNDGKTLAMACHDGVIRVLDVASGRQIRTMNEVGGQAMDLQFSPDGRFLGAVSHYGSLLLWSLPDGGYSRFEDNGMDRLALLAFASDGQRVVLAGDNGELVIRDLAADQFHILDKGGRTVTHLAFDQSTVNVAYADGEVKQYGVETGKSKVLLEAGSSKVVAMGVNPTGSLVVCAADGEVCWFNPGADIPQKQTLKSTLAGAAMDPSNGSLLLRLDDQPWRALYQNRRFPDIQRQLDGVAYAGDVLVGYDEAGGLYLYRIKDDVSVARLSGHRGRTWALAFSPDGKQVVSGGGGGRLLVWDLNSGRCHTLWEHKGFIHQLDWSEDGGLVFASGDKTVGLWDQIGQSAEPRVFTQSGAVYTVAVDPSGRQIAAGGRGKIIRLINPSDQSSKDLIGHTDRVLGIAYSGDGRMLASISSDLTARIWDLAGMGDPLVLDLAKNGGGKFVDLSPDGSLLAIGMVDRVVELYDPNTGRLLHELEGHTDSLTCVVFSPDGSILASASYDGSIRLWDVADRTTVLVLKGRQGSVNRMAFSPDGKRLACTGEDQVIRLWDITPPFLKSALEGHDGSVLAAAFSPDGKTVVSASKDKTLRIWGLAGGEPRVLRGHTGRLNCVAYSPTGKLVASSSTAGNVRLWEVASGRSKVLKGHKGVVVGVAFSPDGALLASASMDNTVRLWDGVSGAERHVLSDYEDSILAVDFSSDGRRLATASFDRTILVWDLDSMEERYRLRDHNDGVFGIAFSPDDTRLATASADKTVWIRNAEDGSPIRILRGFSDWVYGVAWSPDGRTLVTSDAEARVVVWDPDSGRRKAVLLGHRADVNAAMAFSPDGKLLATPSNDQTVRLWRMDHLPLVPEGVDRASWNDELLKRSLYWMGYRMEGLQLHPEPRAHLQWEGNAIGSYPLDFLDRPRPAEKRPMEWLAQGL